MEFFTLTSRSGTRLIITYITTTSVLGQLHEKQLEKPPTQVAAHSIGVGVRKIDFPCLYTEVNCPSFPS